jgi:hypothetical protein
VRNYELWVRQHTKVVGDQLAAKHRQMADNLIRFLRGTFFRWAQMFPAVCKDLHNAPRVLAIGDLHIGSFGTWRDGCGRLAWGVDDFDEAYPLPYANDLVRLAVSASLDAKEGDLSVRMKDTCDFIIDGYREALKTGGRPFVLEEDHKWLRDHALARLDVPDKFWRKIDRLPASRSAIPAAAERAIRESLPAPRLPLKIKRRIAGDGSLGHPRFVGVADWQGGQIAIEAKSAIPSAAGWADGSYCEEIFYQKALNSSVRSPDPFVKLKGKWLVRRLAPDSSALEIETLEGEKDEERLLGAMAWEAANVHCGSFRSPKRILKDLNNRPAKWLRSAVKDMGKAVIRDWRDWKHTQS